jgi:hypothetical protein
MSSRLAVTDMSASDAMELMLKEWKGGPVQVPGREDTDKCNRASEPRLLLHQMAVWYAAGQLAGAKPERGLLVWHSTGTGKTLSAAAVIDAVWTSSQFQKIIFGSLPEAMRANPASRFHEYLADFFPRFKGQDSREVASRCSRRGVVFNSLAKIAHKTGLERASKDADPFFLQDAVFIIDEAHNLFSPSTRQLPEVRALRRYLLECAGSQNASNPRVVLLTATPGDTPEQLLTLLNIVRPNGTPEIRVPDVDDPAQVREFLARTQSLVSFFDQSSDSTRFPSIIDVDRHPCNMDLPQYARYLQAVATGDIKMMQRYSNMMHTWDLEKKVPPEGGNRRLLEELPKFSCKLAELLVQLSRWPLEKHYIYSVFHDRRGMGGQGVMAIAKILKLAGWQQVTPSQAAKLNNGVPETKAPRFVMAVTSQLTRSTSKDAAQSNEAARSLAAILRVFNSDANAHGEYVQIFLASQGYNEGIDLKAVRHVHVFEAFSDQAKDQQTVGRAARMCSHRQLDRADGEWLVQVHRYVSELPMETAVRARIQELAEQAQKTRDPLTKRKLSADVKRLEALGLQRVVVIDDYVRKKALANSLQLRTLHQLVMNNALDCKMFEDFHHANHPQLRCNT